MYDNPYIQIDSNRIHKTALIGNNVKLGTGNKIGAFAVIGSDGEIRGTKDKQFKGTIEIGNNNVISELVTIQAPEQEGSKTTIGSDCIIMAHSHIGHDATIEDDVEISTGTVICGHCVIKKGARIKVKSSIRNRATVGECAIIGMGSVVTKDIPANTTVYGNPAKPKL